MAKRARKHKQSSPPIIPIAVGAVVLIVVAGLVLSIESQGIGSRAAGAAGENPTAQALNTVAIPYPGVPRISVAEVRAGMGSGQVLLVDVRSQDSYDKLHATGALSIPEEQMDDRVQELPRDKQIVLYCT